ncbi:MAG: Elongation factor Ts [candidate division BRC1 bacterium ADurb.BinA364]|nr:MAG: Elongation factor Ts [candidate division BRC1 bacterium ADurb.BinA364]
MTAISASMVKDLRDATSAGMMDCKKALTEAKGDMDRAKELLREWGIARSDKRAGREAREGLIISYIHHSGKVGVLLELNCETDFVARTDKFRELGNDLAMHIAAASPQFVSEADVDEASLESERRICRQQALNEGKPEAIVDKIVEGRMKSFFKDFCLLQQAFVKDEKKDIETLLKEMSGTVGEKISVSRFIRYQVGESAKE